MLLDIVKSHGTANDFVLHEDLDDEVVLDPHLIARLCDRHRGIGADGVIRVAPGTGAPVYMDHHNADGSQPEMCGNGIRCLAKYCFDRGILTGTSAVVETRAGLRTVAVHRGADGRVSQVEVDMGAPQITPDAVPVEAEGPDALELPLRLGDDAVTVAAVGMGNPHAVLWVDDPRSAPVTSLGPLIEQHPAFPNGANVEFVTVRGSGHLDMRVWERGVGETMACGTGACAAAVVSARLGRTGSSVDVGLPGGLLHIEVGESITMTGPAVEVFETTVDTTRL